jgi:phage terminase large subunit-like protein
MASADEFYFDERAAVIAVAFFERLLHHSKGEWAGQSFTLEPWQREMVRTVFGWKRKSDGTRRYRKVYLEIPRKNGKSTIAAGFALALLFADVEPGAEVYSAASDKDQAGIVFSEAKAMVSDSPQLSELATTYKSSIVVNNSRSFYRVLSADAFTKHGLNAHGVVIDELHAQPNRDLFDVLWTSQGARRQPMFIMITTAGYDRESVCWEQHEYARKVRDGIIDDPEWFVLIFAADEKDDWRDPVTWHKANPNLDVTVKEDYLKSEAARAEQVPAYQNTFRRLHLNQWTQQATKWLDLNLWNTCGEPFDEKLLEGAECYGGLDLASSSDLASFAMLFPSERGEPEFYRWITRFWIPEDNLVQRALKDRVPYDAWQRDGYITTTPGNVIDFDFIIKDIEALGERFNIKEIAFDRWGAFQVSNKLTGAGFTMVGFGQGFVSMSTPTKDMLRLIKAKQIGHRGNPVLTWMADNIVVDIDAAENVKPNKQKSREKIDGIVAGIMALDRAIRSREAKPKSVYEKRGVRTV